MDSLQTLIKSEPELIIEDYDESVEVAFPVEGTMNSEPFQCYLCGKSFPSSNVIQEHMNLQHPDSASATTVPDISYAATGTDDAPDGYQCKICQKSFTTPADLLKDWKRHTKHLDTNFVGCDVPPLYCEICRRLYTRWSNFEKHLKIHAAGYGESFQCKVCPRKYTRFANLRRHEQMHEDGAVLSFRCEICRRSYSGSSTLRNHLKIHGVGGDEASLQCKICKSSFHNTFNLRRHYERVHTTGEKPHQCKLCDRSFMLAQKLRTHMSSHTGEK